MSRKVVVTGLGAVTPIGDDVAETWEGLVAGRSGVRNIERFDASGFSTRFAAQVSSLPSLDGIWAQASERWGAVDQLDRKSRLMLSAASEAWTQAGGDERGARGECAETHMHYTKNGPLFISDIVKCNTLTTSICACMQVRPAKLHYGFPHEAAISKDGVSPHSRGHRHRHRLRLQL